MLICWCSLTSTTCPPCNSMFRTCSDHVGTWNIMFSMFSMFSMFISCSEPLNMFWTWNWTWHVQIMFNIHLSCSNHVLACLVHVQVQLRYSWTWTSWTWISCSGTWFHVPEHDETCSNMTIMFRTWHSCSEHDHHVQNMTIMFRTRQSQYWTRLSCSGHGCHVLVMFWTW